MATPLLTIVARVVLDEVQVTWVVIAWVEPAGRRLPEDPLIIHGLQFTSLDWALARTLGALLMEIG